MAETAKAPTLGLRPPAEVLARLDALAAAVTERTGVTARRGGVAMDALLAGLDLLEKRQGGRQGKGKR